MGKRVGEPTLRNRDWALRYPDAVRHAQEFFHGDGVDPDALDVLRSKGYVTIDFRTLDGAERIEAMFSAVTNGVYDPSTGELKVLDLHLKHLKDKDEGEDTGKQAEVLGFLDLLQKMASADRPEWAKSAKTDAPAPKIDTRETSVSDLMKDMGLL